LVRHGAYVQALLIHFVRPRLYNKSLFFVRSTGRRQKEVARMSQMAGASRARSAPRAAARGRKTTPRASAAPRAGAGTAKTLAEISRQQAELKALVQAIKKELDQMRSGGRRRRRRGRPTSIPESVPLTQVVGYLRYEEGRSIQSIATILSSPPFNLSTASGGRYGISHVQLLLRRAPAPST